MSELVYINYLKDLNSTLIENSYDLNLDFEIGSSYVMEQLNVLELYLTLNNFILQNEKGQGLSNLIGFTEVTESIWRNRYIEKRKKELQEIQKKNQLFARSSKAKIIINKFDKETIKDIEQELVDLDIDLFEEDENEIENNLGDNLSDFDLEAKYSLDEENSDEDTHNDAEDAPLLTDIFNDLQKAQNLFDEDDIEDYQDEYAIVEDEEEIEEPYPEDAYEQNTGFDFDEPSTSTNNDSLFDFPNENFANNDFNMDSSAPFNFEQSISNEQPKTNEQRERVFTDAMVDKANDAINKGINALLKKIAK